MGIKTIYCIGYNIPIKQMANHLPVPITRCDVPLMYEVENLQLIFEAKYLQAIYNIRNADRKNNTTW